MSGEIDSDYPVHPGEIVNTHTLEEIIACTSSYYSSGTHPMVTKMCATILEALPMFKQELINRGAEGAYYDIVDVMTKRIGGE